MPRFLVLYRSSTSARDQMANATPEQMKAGMDEWMAWAGKAGDSVVDLGSPLAPAVNVGSGSAAAATADIAGFSVLESDSAAAVAGILADHPHLSMPGNTIEVLEYLRMPGS